MKNKYVIYEKLFCELFSITTEEILLLTFKITITLLIIDSTSTSLRYIVFKKRK